MQHLRFAFFFTPLLILLPFHPDASLSAHPGHGTPQAREDSAGTRFVALAERDTTEMRGRLSLSVRAGVIRLERPEWNLAPCISASANIALGSNLFASADASYGWASYGTPQYIHDAFGEESDEPAYKAFALTFGLGYRTAGYTEPAFYVVAGGGVATYRVPFVPVPGQAYGLFGWAPGEVPFQDETSLAASFRSGFEYPLWGNNRLTFEAGVVANLQAAKSSYFVPVTAGMVFNL